MTHASTAGRLSRTMLTIGLLPGLLLLSPFPGKAQSSNILLPSGGSGYDMKQYSMDMLRSDPASNQQILAGTIYKSGGTFSGNSDNFNVVHFMRIDASGNIMDSKEYPVPATSNLLPPPNARSIDLSYRAVDIESSTTPNKHFILCQGVYTPTIRLHSVPPPPPQGPFSGTPFKDHIRLLEVQDDGTLVAANDIVDNTFVYSGGNGNHMYATSMTYDGTQYLYICGYLYEHWSTTAIGSHTWGPQFGQTKRAFLLKVDVNTLQVVASQWYDWATTVPDYDIAMRVKIIATGLYAGNLFVTGSYTEPSGSAAGQRSGVMSLIVDPTSPFLTPIADKSFASAQGDGGNDYGIALVEKGSNFHIIGNHFTDQTGSKPYMEGSLDPLPWGAFVATADDNFDFIFSPYAQRRTHPGFWATGAMETANPFQSSSSDHFLLAGLTNYPYMNPFPPSNKNICPVLVDVERYTTSAAKGRMTVFGNNTGTGDPGANYNNYYTLGWGISNIAWNPVFAARNTTNDPIFFSAPKWDAGYGRLGLKWLEAPFIPTITSVPTYEGYDSPCEYAVWDYDMYNNDIADALVSVSWGAMSVINNNNGGTNPNFGMELPVPCSPDNYKTTTISEQSNVTGVVSLYPNPATGEIRIKGITKASYRITDMTGRELQTGKISSLHNTVDIESLAPAMYFIEVSENGKSTKLKFIKE